MFSVTCDSILMYNKHHVFCLETGPQPLEKRVLEIVRSSDSSFSFQTILVSFAPLSSCLRLVPRLPLSCIFPSIACFRMQFLNSCSEVLAQKDDIIVRKRVMKSSSVC